MNAATTLPPGTHGGPETLASALERARSQLDREQPPKAVRSALFVAFGRQRPGRPARRWWLSGFALCLFLLVCSLALMVGLQAPGDDGAGELQAGSSFMPLVPAERWPQLLREAGEGGPVWVVAADLPRERLAALGLPYDPSRAGDRVRAELLLHPASGDVLAVRLLP